MSARFGSGSKFPRKTRPFLFLGATLLLIGGCECPPAPDQAYYRMPADSLSTPGTALVLPGSARDSHSHPSKGTPPGGAVQQSKIHPDVDALIAANPNGIDTLLISFRDTVEVKSLRGLDGADLRGKLVGLRLATQASDSTRLVDNHGATVIKKYWLIEAFLVEIPLANVQALAAEPRVTRIEPRYSGDPPDECGSDATTAGWTAETIDAASAYAEFAGGRIALFDTGIDEDHKLLNGNGQLGQRYTCSLGGCNEEEVQDDYYPWGHGTASASVLVASENLESGKYRGMTQATLDSYMVYGGDPATCKTDVDATIEAFQLAAMQPTPYDVFLPVVAVSAGGAGGLTQLANKVYALGIPVITPNGTVGGSEIPSPAVSALALGVGSYCVLTDVFRNLYTIGETPDKRPKPDLTAPTGVFTAARDPNDPDNVEKVREYVGTSCSAPVAAGAALMLRNWLDATVEESVDPGLVYTLLYTCTETDGADPREGSGRLRLPTSGTLYLGTLSLEQGKSWKVPITVTEGVEAEVSAAIWWPEYGDDGTGIPVDELRDDFDLYLLDETGAVRDQSTSFASVFERVESGGVRGTAWSLEIVGYEVQEESKDVYWALWVKD